MASKFNLVLNFEAWKITWRFLYVHSLIFGMVAFTILLNVWLSYAFLAELEKFGFCIGCMAYFAKTDKDIKIYGNFKMVGREDYREKE